MYDKPRYRLARNTPCDSCGHRNEQHRFMFGVVANTQQGTQYLDRYRCEANDAAGNLCSCGENFTPKSFAVPPHLQYMLETDGGRRDLIEMISRGELPGVEYKPK
jgi:hypothetical protein